MNSVSESSWASTCGRGSAGGARRRDAVEHPVQLVMLEDDGLVEALDERAAVIAGRQDAVVLELDDCFLDRDPAQAELVGDLVAVDPIS